MDLPKPSDTPDTEAQPPQTAETSSKSNVEKLESEAAKTAGSFERKEEPELIELDIGSESGFNPDDLAHLVLVEPADPHIRILNQFVADSFVRYREARRAGRNQSEARAAHWEERSEYYADRTIKIIEMAHKMRNHGQQKVVVEHRNDPDRQAPASRRSRSTVRQTQDASLVAANRKV